VSKLLPFSPRISSRVIRMRAIPDSWTGSQLYSPETDFLRVWLEPEERPQPSGVNWGAIYGLALSAVFSAGCWTGVAMLIERILK
jgi:hypothetical protein